MKSSWPPMPENCAPAIVSADDLAVDVDRQRPVDRDHLLVAGDRLGGVDQVDGEERHVVVLMQPAVEGLVARGEGRDRDPVVAPLVGVRHLARLVQRHQAVREHLGMHAVVAARGARQLARDRRRDRADAGLQGGPVGHERRSVARDLKVRFARLSLGERQGRRVGLDEDVDLLDLQRVPVLGLEPEGPGEVLRDLHDEQALRVLRRPHQLQRRASRVERQRAPAVRVRRRGRGCHRAGRLLLEQRREPAEVRGGKADVRALVAKRPLERPVEPGEVMDVLVVEEGGPDAEQGAVDPQVLPVGALAQRRHERRRLPGREWDPERVRSLQSGGGVGSAERLGHGADSMRDDP